MEAGWLTVKIPCPALCSICNELPSPWQMCLMLKLPHTQTAMSRTGFLKCLLSLNCPGVLPHDLQTLRLYPRGLACCSNTSHSFQPPLSSCQHFTPPVGQGDVLNNLHYCYLILSWRGSEGNPDQLAQWGGGLDGERVLEASRPRLESLLLQLMKLYLTWQVISTLLASVSLTIKWWENPNLIGL